jgi:hypothetical protein
MHSILYCKLLDEGKPIKGRPKKGKSVKNFFFNAKEGFRRGGKYSHAVLDDDEDITFADISDGMPVSIHFAMQTSIRVFFFLQKLYC